MLATGDAIEVAGVELGMDLVTPPNTSMTVLDPRVWLSEIKELISDCMLWLPEGLLRSEMLAFEYPPMLGATAL